MLTFNLFAQHSTQDIAQQMSELSKNYGKYDADDGFDSVCNKLNGYISALESVSAPSAEQIAAAAVWHSYRAEFWYSYLEGNAYRIEARTAGTSHNLNDIKTWDIPTFCAQIIAEFQKSLQHKRELVAIPDDAYRPLFKDVPEINCYTSIYDLLAYRFADKMSGKFPRLTQPASTFSINQPEFFDELLPALTTSDTLSTAYHYLNILREIEQAHLTDADISALQYCQLMRYEYLNKNCTLKNKDSLYRIALQRIIDYGNGNRAVLQLAHFRMANWFAKRAGSKQARPDDYLTALQYYAMAAELDRKSPLGVQCLQMVKDIQKPTYACGTLNDPYPELQLCSFVTKNVDALYYLIVEGDKRYAWQGTNIKTVHSGTVATQNNHQFRPDTTIATLPELPAGEYTILFSNKPFASKTHLSSTQKDDYSAEYINVSSITYKYLKENDRLLVWVTDVKSGEPVEGAALQLDATNWNNKVLYSEQAESNAEGFAQFSLQNFKKHLESNSYHLSIQYRKNKKETVIYRYNESEASDNQTVEGHIYTDRTIYRPGQKVQWKAILTLESQYDNAPLDAGEMVTVQLMADNGDLIAADTVNTNEFGSAAGEFDLPQTGYLGLHSLTLRYKGKHYCGSCDIRVEAYKRPTFEAELETPDGTYKIGEDVAIKGTAKAFAGYAITNAKVSYHVTRKTSFPFRHWGWWNNPFSSRPDMEITSGECSTDEDGNFQFDFKALGDNEVCTFKPLYNYHVEVTVTDESGETHSAHISVPVSEQTLRFNVDLPQCVFVGEKKNDFALTVLNLAGKPQSVDVDYQVFPLEMPARYLLPAPFNCGSLSDEVRAQFPQYAFHGEENPNNWKTKAVCEKGHIVSSDQSRISFSNINNWSTGAYKLTLSTIDTFGQKIEEEIIFYVANRSAEFPQYVPLSVTSNTHNAKVGEKISFYISSYMKGQFVLVRITNNDRVLEQKWIKLNQSTYTFQHVVKDGEEGDFCCHAYANREGKCYSESAEIHIPFLKKNIDFEFITFRDKLQPGEKEAVRIVLKDADGKRLDRAELLCGMYDASLDALAPANYWQRFVWRSYPTSPTINSPYIENMSVRMPSLWPVFPITYDCEIPDWKYWCDIFGYGHPYRMLYSKATIANLCADAVMEKAEMTEDMAFAAGLLADAESIGASDAVVVEESQQEKEERKTSVQPRTNFAETAFFYPFLRTNENGEIEISYTIPECLTEWKMMGLAHTQDQKDGVFEKTVLTQKELMVVPNAPRFVYEGDQLQFAAKVVKTGQQPLSGTAELTLFNAETGERLLQQQQPFTLNDESTMALKFSVDIPMGLTAITYRIVARAQSDNGTFSDGEENMLPVLSRRQLVTETMPLFITRKGSKTFSFSNLPASAHDIVSCKLQFTADPKWNAVLALPYLMEYPYDCNEQLFSKLYANTMAAFIVQQNPNFRTLLQAASKENPEALRSKLEQNADVKQILLEETPWVRDAQDEDNDIQNIFCLFEPENVAAECKQMVQKLTQNQNNDGGWHWFSQDNRYESSRYITQHILIGTGRLLDKNICKKGHNFLTDNVIRNAVNFIDRDMQKDFEELKKNYPGYAKENLLSDDAIHYLYARSFFLTEKRPTTAAYNFYKGQLTRYAKELDNIYLKAMAALTLFQSGDTDNKKLAKDLMNDIKKQAIHSEEFGMYWRKSGNGYYWSESLIERQALLIEAFATILQDEESVKKMKIWLLQQKRTQHWETTRATADACHALLSDKEKAAGKAPAQISVSLCDTTYQFADTLQAPVKHDVEACLKNGHTGDIVLSRDNDGLSFGGVFVQYYQDIDEIKTTGSEIPLSVERKVYRVTMGQRGETLEEIDARGGLKVGDKVRVRMELRCDRDLEYVHLKDLRAAALEPTETLSGHHWQDGLRYYQSFRDASVNFFFDHIFKGTYVFEYTLYATQTGTFSNGYASVQCLYAPEFCAHSASQKIVVKE